MDEQWGELRRAWSQPASDDDWRRAWAAWRVLDYQQKAVAIAGLARDLVGLENALPASYIERRMWQRGERKQPKRSAGIMKLDENGHAP